MEIFYDLGKSPPTHDFINFLVRAEQARVLNREESIQIRFVRGYRKLSDRDKVYSNERRDWRVVNLLFNLCWLLPSVDDVSFGDGEQFHSYLNFGEPQKPVLKVPLAAASVVSKALEGIENPVSITFRQSDFELTRNSNIRAWSDVADWLKANGCTPIIVPDAEADMLNRHVDTGHFTYKAAAHSVQIKLALYEQCKVNLMTTGGPMVLALFSDVPLMAFKLIIPGLKCTTESHMRKSAMSEDDDWGEYKKLFWGNDDADYIIGKLEQLLPKFLSVDRRQSNDCFLANKAIPAAGALANATTAKGR